ncbi:MAG TPA: (deoxy)nucleoside triphosphate pyrophosphohydrolase [Prolixibacteraceae bacterium]|nr:(deoxy)nucleoside triphosphate pyrophosphohydrolase [Prolixibacteraceae bacterium]
MKRIDVTCAIIVENGKILACQRGAESDHPHEWEFPGGKVEPGEEVAACIVREIKEELLIDVVVVKILAPLEYDYPMKKIKLIPCICTIINGQPKATEHEAVKWLPLEQFLSLKWSNADCEVFLTHKAELECLS